MSTSGAKEYFDVLKTNVDKDRHESQARLVLIMAYLKQQEQKHDGRECDEEDSSRGLKKRKSQALITTDESTSSQKVATEEGEFERKRRLRMASNAEELLRCGLDKGTILYGGVAVHRPPAVKKNDGKAESSSESSDEAWNAE
jgi:hypothetical protein